MATIVWRGKWNFELIERNFIIFLSLSLSLSPYSPPLPSNFVSLGDPSSQPGILNVSRNFGTTAPGSQGQIPPTLSPETISEIIETAFNKSMSL